MNWIARGGLHTTTWKSITYIRKDVLRRPTNLDGTLLLIWFMVGHITDWVVTILSTPIMIPIYNAESQSKLVHIGIFIGCKVYLLKYLYVSWNRWWFTYNMKEDIVSYLLLFTLSHMWTSHIYVINKITYIIYTLYILEIIIRYIFRHISQILNYPSSSTLWWPPDVIIYVGNIKK